MRIREFRDTDIGDLLIYFKEQNLGYELPAMNSEDFPVRYVMADDDDVMRVAIFARRTVELYMVMDEKWDTPGTRLGAFTWLHESVEAKLKDLGYLDGNFWCPPKKKSFGRRLMKRFGWSRNLWHNFQRKTGV